MEVLKNAALGAAFGLGIAVLDLSVLGIPGGPGAYRALVVSLALGGVVGALCGLWKPKGPKGGLKVS
jgi:hypothetical protein